MDLRSSSTMSVFVSVTAGIGGVPYDPTADPVSMAFLPNGVSPTSGDWHNATWQTIGGVNYAVCLVGPANGGVVLALGTWACSVKVTDDPEVPVLTAGYINIIP